MFFTREVRSFLTSYTIVTALGYLPGADQVSNSGIERVHVKA
jgi:hypothetical protein